MFTEEQIPELLAQLTLEEKCSLLSGSDFWHTQPVERLGIPALMVSDGPHGLRKQAEGADDMGLEESVPATCFPTAAALASTWDVALLTERRDPGSGREPETLPAVRAELRVLLGGPPAGGRAGRCSGRGYPVRRGRDLRETFRRQQPGN